MGRAGRENDGSPFGRSAEYLAYYELTYVDINAYFKEGDFAHG